MKNQTCGQGVWEEEGGEKVIEAGKFHTDET
jgi:hypothetical protein